MLRAGAGVIGQPQHLAASAPKEGNSLAHLDGGILFAIFDAPSKPGSNVKRHYFHGFAVRTALQLEVLKATFDW